MLPLSNGSGGGSVGKTSAASKNKYRDKTYDRAEIVLSKGSKAVLQDHAKQRGESFNGFINRAINEAIKRDKNKPPVGKSGQRAEKPSA